MKKEQALEIIKQALEIAISSGKITKLEDTAVLLEAFKIISNTNE
jgi:hypothetical protein